MKPMKLIGWGILVIVALVAVVFAIHNHGPYTLNFWPLPYQVAAPLYLIVLAALAIGFITGALASWVAGRSWRQLARRRRRENDALMRELDTLKADARRRALPAPQEAPELAVGSRGAVKDG